MAGLGDRVLLRCFKNFRTASADGDPETLFNAEFCDRLGPDLHLSVYEVDASQWLEAFMCHRAAAGTDPPRFAHAVDVAPLCARSTPVPVEGCAFEAYLSTYHHEIDFADETELRAFVTELVAAINAKQVRLFEAPKAELTAWLKERRKAGDQSWLGFLSESERWAKWARAGDSVPPPGA